MSFSSCVYSCRQRSYRAAKAKTLQRIVTSDSAGHSRREEKSAWWRRWMKRLVGVLTLAFRALSLYASGSKLALSITPARLWREEKLGSKWWVGVDRTDSSGQLSSSSVIFDAAKSSFRLPTTTARRWLEGSESEGRTGVRRIEENGITFIRFENFVIQEQDATPNKTRRDADFLSLSRFPFRCPGLQHPVLQVDTVAMNAGVPSLPPDTIVPIVIGPPSSPPTQPTNPSASASSAEASAFDLSAFGARTTSDGTCTNSFTNGVGVAICGCKLQVGGKGDLGCWKGDLGFTQRWWSWGTGMGRSKGCARKRLQRVEARSATLVSHPTPAPANPSSQTTNRAYFVSSLLRTPKSCEKSSPAQELMARSPDEVRRETLIDFKSLCVSKRDLGVRVVLGSKIWRVQRVESNRVESSKPSSLRAFAGGVKASSSPRGSSVILRVDFKYRCPSIWLRTASCISYPVSPKYSTAL
ncbi:hypothetical protein SCHPADRAFT_895699 [Schizopora paradoxa]|uniref:Uncharacterized protein n=1 Tax=Schizopora paradoxa TaxID=27342 RepID=A0A0H2R9I1_9AGAM|nr:hypothetical protein SCHPADRAFT_895699 [Schizopora paradoxa]